MSMIGMIESVVKPQALRESYVRGLGQDLLRGQTERLDKILCQRFGPHWHEHAPPLGMATRRQLELWLDRCKTAPDLMSVFDRRDGSRMSGRQTWKSSLGAETTPPAAFVLFWRGNDSTLSGQRHDVLAKVLNEHPFVDTLIVFDAPVRMQDWIDLRDRSRPLSSDCHVAANIFDIRWGRELSGPGRHEVFVWDDHPDGARSCTCWARCEQDRQTLHLDFVDSVLRSEGVDPRHSVFWFFPPFPDATMLVEHLRPGRVVVEFAEDVPAQGTERGEDFERSLNGRADRVIVPHGAPVPWTDGSHGHVDCVREAIQLPVAHGVLEAADDPETLALRLWPGPSAAFIGPLDDLVDEELLRQLATHRPDVQWILLGAPAGDERVKWLALLPNVRLMGFTCLDTAHSWALSCDIGIVPYKRGQAIAQPARYERAICTLVGAGLPVVSTAGCDVPAALRHRVHLAPGPQEFLSAVDTLLDSVQHTLRQAPTVIDIGGESGAYRYGPIIDAEVGARPPTPGTEAGNDG